MNSWFHTATLAKLKTPIGSPDLREFHQLYTGQVPENDRRAAAQTNNLISARMGPQPVTWQSARARFCSDTPLTYVMMFADAFPVVLHPGPRELRSFSWISLLETTP